MLKRILVASAALLVAAPALGAGKDKGDKGKKTVLVLNVAPESTEVYIDGKKKGTADKVKELTLEPGNHIVRLVHKGDEHEDQVTLKKGFKTTFEWKFEDDRPKPAQPEGEQPAQEAPPAEGGGEQK